MTLKSGNNTNEAEIPAKTEETSTKHSHSKAYRKQNIAQRLAIVKRALDNSKNNPEISAQLAVFGYNSERILFFENLYNEAVEANSYQQKEFGEKFEAHAEFERLLLSLRDYFGALSVARVAFKNNPKSLPNLEQIK